MKNPNKDFFINVIRRDCNNVFTLNIDSGFEIQIAYRTPDGYEDKLIVEGNREVLEVYADTLIYRKEMK